MESLLQTVVRRFVSEEHIRQVLSGEWSPMFDEHGNQLEGIQGRMGACATTAEGVEFGADLIEMQPGSAFPLHVHPGDHILYVVEGIAHVHVDGVDHTVRTGDTIFIPAEYPHGVRSHPEATEAVKILAVGHPHKHVSALDRMTVLEEDGAHAHDHHHHHDRNGHNHG